MSSELTLIDQFFTYYPQHHSNRITNLTPYETTAWTNACPGRATYPDTGYYRALLHNVVAGIIHLNNRAPGAADPLLVSLPRLIALYERVLEHYNKRLTGERGGWGFQRNDSNQQRLLTNHGEFMGSPLTLASALLWPHLDSTQRTTARGVLRDYANRILTWRTQSHYLSIQSIDNTASEEASACASFLALMSALDPSHTNANAWLARAKLLMVWAYQNSLTRRLVPPNDLNQHPTNYAGTLANHNMFPHPLYGFSLLNESAVAATAWAASGRADHFHLALPSLYGSSVDVAYQIYKANVAFIEGTSPEGNLPINPSLKLRGYTYPATQLSWTNPPPAPLAFNAQQYNCAGVTLPPGCSDWGTGIEFQNAAFALLSWIDNTFMPSLGTGYYNYQRVLAGQAQHQGYGYLPTAYISRTWQWAYLNATATGSMPNDGARMLINFFLPNFPALTLAGQINTHYFLNSYNAYNHAVAWLLNSNYWNDFAIPGQRTLPNVKE